MKNPTLFTEPNKYAPQTSWKSYDDSIRVEGYQSFNISKDKIYNIGVDHVKEKYDVLQPLFRKFRNKSFLDLGCHNGLFSFLANNNGMFPIVMMDIDDDSINVIKFLTNYIGPKYKFTIIKDNVYNCRFKCDIVNALALIHWLYSCTSVYGSLDSIIKHLSECTGESLFIEWIEPTDGAVQFFKHLDYNPEFTTEEYNKENFLKAIDKYFFNYCLLKTLSNGRELYRCNKESQYS
jgi:hypothetical protein